MDIEKAKKAQGILLELEKWKGKKDQLDKAMVFFTDHYKKYPLKVWKASEVEGSLSVRISTTGIDLNGDELQVAVSAIRTMILTRMTMLENDLENL